MTSVLDERRVALHGTPEWFQARQHGVSATAVANACTAAGFQEEVAKAVWPEDNQIADNEYMKFGRDWEDWIVANLPAEYGFTGNQWLYHAPEQNWHLATPDGIDASGLVIAEVKTTGKDWNTVPARYMRQIQWQIYVMDAEACVLGWLLRGTDNDGQFVPAWFEPKHLLIERDEVLIAELKAVATKLQYECVMGCNTERNKNVARFNLEDYETVEDRLKRFWSKYPDGAIQTDMLNTDADRERKQWIVQAWVYRHRDDVRAIGTGLAFEIDGTQGANQTAALENAETSAIGRALANCGFSGNKRASREEMAKANRGNVTMLPGAITEPTIDPTKATTTDELNTMWAEAVATGQSKMLQAAFTKRKKELADS